jgi:hypothetical protein
VKQRLAWLLLGLLAVAVPASARIKLVALPERTRMVVSLAHPSAVLVQEERVVTLKKGLNRLDFAWQGVALDADSIQLAALQHPGEVVLLNTSFPPGENALIWEVSSAEAREETMRITYLVAGLDRTYTYTAVARSDESELTLRTFLRLNNQTGEDLTDAEFVVPGSPSLVRNLDHDEIVELLVDRSDGVKPRRLLTWDAAVQPWEPEYAAQTPGLPLAYVMVNERSIGLGRAPLPAGKARVFIATAERDEAGKPTAEGQAFLGEDWAPLAPLQREWRLHLGESRDVKVVQKKMKNERINIRRNKMGQDVVWDTDELFKIEVQNFKTKSVEAVLVQHVSGGWKLVEQSHPSERKDAFTLEFPLKLAAGARETVTFRIQRMNVQGNREPVSY